MKKETHKINRCEWCTDDPIYQKYHDTEWGVPKYDDQALFEMIVLEGAQAGLSWLTILRKRDHYRHLFYDFNISKVACMTDADVERLMLDPGIVRNRLKIKSAINNAKIVITIQKQYGSFSKWLWDHVNHQPIINRPKSISEVNSTSELSDQISQSLKKFGMNFVGSTIMYAFLQSTGIINDHTDLCHCSQHKNN